MFSAVPGSPASPLPPFMACGVKLGPGGPGTPVSPLSPLPPGPPGEPSLPGNPGSPGEEKVGIRNIQHGHFVLHFLTHSLIFGTYLVCVI